MRAQDKVGHNNKKAIPHETTDEMVKDLLMLLPYGLTESVMDAKMIIGQVDELVEYGINLQDALMHDHVKCARMTNIK